MPRTVAYIHTLLRSDCFYEVEELVRHDPSQAAALNSAKSSPLGVLVKNLTQGTVQTALSQNIPRYVEGVELALDALVTACPNAVAHRNKYGDTPFILACRDGHLASGSYMRGSTSYDILKWAVDRMIDACPEAARIPDSRGELPIHHVLDLGLGGPMDLVVKLVRAYPESLLQHNGMCPSTIVPMMVDSIHSADTCLWERVKTLVSLVPASALAQGRSQYNAIQALWFKIRGRPDYLARQQLGQSLPIIPQRLPDDMITDIANKMTDGQDEFYSKALDLLLFLLKAGYRETSTSSDDDNVENLRAVHAAAGLHIPAEALRLVIKLFPEQLHEVDHVDGRMPLHIAAAGLWKSRGFGEIDVPTGLDILVQAYPDAVRLLDQSGNLPLHLALQNESLFPSWDRGIKALVQAAPMTLRTTNGSGTYPFLLAAELRDHSITGSRDGHNLVYEMLRADPGVLQLAARG